MNYIRQNLAKDLGMCQDEITENMRDFRLGLRPMSPDNLEIIGPMRQFPNVILNVGYGPQGF